MATEFDSATESMEIKSVLVVDDDEVARNLIVNYLKKMGYADIESLESGDAAWDAIKKKRYDFLVLDWKLPGLSGLALFNRIRRLQSYKNVPLLVVSGFLDKNDFRLLQEFSCTALMEKPFTNMLFENKVEELIRERLWYAQNVAMVDMLLEAVEGDEKKSETLLKQLLKRAPNPIPLALIAARRLSRASLFTSAEKVLRGVLKLDDGCVMAMNELGKVLHYLGRHSQALDILRQASRLSPQNLQRLCLLGEVELNLNDPEAARAYFDGALELDADDETAKAGLVVAENMRAMESMPSVAQVGGSFASIMNTLGIALVRNGEYERGIKQYRSAMSFLHSRGDSARVAFNLGLGYLRWGKPQEALTWFQKSERMGDATFAKSTTYVAKLIAAGGKGGRDAAHDVPFASIKDKRSIPQSGEEMVGDDDAPLSDSAMVIPFPMAEKKLPESDDIAEESVSDSGEMVLRHPGDLVASIGDDLSEDEDLALRNVGEPDDDSPALEL